MLGPPLLRLRAHGRHPALIATPTRAESITQRSPTRRSTPDSTLAGHNGVVNPEGREDPDELIELAVATLRERGARFVYLFGSRADETANAGSDIDVAAWFGDDRIDALDARGTLPEEIDVVVLDRAPLELAGRVALHGRLLFEAEPAERVRWQATTRKIYLDEVPRTARATRDFRAARLRGRR